MENTKENAQATADAVISNPVTVSTVKEYATNNGFTQIVPTVRANENGYTYLTFINADNKAENVYFSKEAAKLEKTKVGSIVGKGYFDDLTISEYARESDGAAMTKLGVKGGNRAELEDLL